MPSGSLTDALRETLSLFDSSGVPLSTTEVAEQLDLGRRSTYERLKRLMEHGEIESKMAGGSARVWWRPRPETTELLEIAQGDRPIVLESLVDVLDGAEVGVFVLDESFDVAWINEATERYFGLDREQVIGQDKRTLLEDLISGAVDDSDRFSDTVLATYDDNTYTERFRCQVRPGEDREERWLEHRSKPIESGRYAGGRAELYYDITARRRSQRVLQETERQFQSLVDAVEEYAIFMLDPEGHVQTWNEGAREIKGYEEKQIVGEHFSTFYTEEDREAGVPEEHLANATAMGSIEDEGWRTTGDGSTFWANVTITAIYDDDDLVGFAKITRDMTERRERERQIRRQRDEIKAELEGVFDRISDAVVGLDVDLRLTYVNDRAEEFLDTEESALVGRDIREALDLGHDFEAALLEAVESGEPVFVEDYSEPLDTWFDNAIYPSETGVSVYFRDVTDRKERQRRYEAIFDHTFQFTGLMEPDGTLIEANETARSFAGVDREEVVGEKVWDTYWFQHGDAADRARKAVERARDGELVREEIDVQGANRVATIDFSVKPVTDHRGEVVLLVPEGRDITERKERERELEEYRRWTQTLIENFPAGAVALVDQDLRYITFGGRPEGDTDLTWRDLEREPVKEILPEKIADVVVPAYEAALDGQPSEFEDTIDGRVYQFHFVPVRDDDGEVFAATAMSQDVTDRKERERELREAKTQLEAATEAGSVWTFEWHVQGDQMRTGPSMARSFGVDPDDSKGGVSLDQFVESIHEHDRERVERAIEEAVASGGEYKEEYRVWDADGELRWVVARGRVARDEEGNPVTFPGALVDITERKQAELQLELHRQRLEALNDLNDVVRDITEAVIEKSSRAEIEETVCERLADSDSYSFAWIGDIDIPTQTVNLRAEAGVEGYLDDITISVDPDDERSRGPTGRAILERMIQVTQNVDREESHDPWRDHVHEHRFKSSAAIPIIHEDTLYGVLNVYAPRPNAFSEDEREVIGQLGEVIGHAIAAIEQQRALTSDEVVELEFQIGDVFAAIDVSVDMDGTITLDRAVPAGGGTFLEYGTATGDAMEAIEALVEAEAIPHWASVDTMRTDGETTHFQLKMVDPPALSTVTAYGGYVAEACIEDGDYYMKVHLPPSANVRQVVDPIVEAYAGIQLVSQRQVERDGGFPGDVRSTFQEALTERQRAALEAGYFAGYFEWPRDTKGEAVAESLDISPATYHQHLRAGQRKLLGAALDDLTPA